MLFSLVDITKQKYQIEMTHPMVTLLCVENTTTFRYGDSYVGLKCTKHSIGGAAVDRSKFKLYLSIIADVTAHPLAHPVIAWTSRSVQIDYALK